MPKQPKRGSAKETKSISRKKKIKELDPFRKNWEYQCDVCGMSPTVGDSGLCGPCCWGEAETLGGNW